MKHLIALATLSLMSFGAWANSGASCDFRITENTVKCPIIGFCPEKVLRESKMNITEVLNPGQVIDGKLVLNKVVLFPGTKNQDKHSVYQLPGDNRVSVLKEEKEIDLVEFASKTEVQYSISSVGDTVHVRISTDGDSYRIRLIGDYKGRVDGWIQMKVLDAKGKRSILPLYFTCSKTSEQAISESELQKEAVDKYLEEKKKQEELEAQANQQ